MDIDKVFDNQKETRWVNKQRTLIVTSRNVSARVNQLFHDLHELLPHSKKETKLEKGNTSNQIKDLCMANSCRSFIYFEVHRKHDLYIWIGRFPNGPSIKYHVENWHNCQDIKLMGNCIKGSRPVLSFDSTFNDTPLQVLQKELFIHTFNVPKHHPKSMPCCDRVLSWIKEGEDSNNIWLRQYEIQYEKAGKDVVKNELVEIGPRIVLKPVVVFEGCLQGAQLYKDKDFVTVAKQGQMKRFEIKQMQFKVQKKQQKKEKMLSKLEIQEDEIENMFDRKEENDGPQEQDNQDYEMDDFQDVD